MSGIGNFSCTSYNKKENICDKITVAREDFFYHAIPYLIFSYEDQPEVGMYAALYPVGAQSQVHVPHSAHHRVVLNRAQL